MKLSPAVLVAGVTAAGVLFVLPRLPFPLSQFTITSQGPTIERLEQLSHLVTNRVYVADVLVGNGAGCRGVWLIHGDGLIAVNLSQAKIVEKNERNKTATISLPLPEVLEARVDHDSTQTWEVRTTTWIPWTSDPDKLRDAVMKEAQKLVGHAAGSKENIQAARLAAETLLQAFYAEFGWHLAVTWEDAKE